MGQFFIKNLLVLITFEFLKKSKHARQNFGQ